MLWWTMLQFDDFSHYTGIRESILTYKKIKHITLKYKG